MPILSPYRSRAKPWQLLPSSLPRHYFRNVTVALAIFALGAWVVLHKHENQVAESAWVVMQLALLLACGSGTLIACYMLAQPMLQSPVWGPYLRAAFVVALVVGFAGLMLGNVLIDIAKHQGFSR